MLRLLFTPRGLRSPLSSSLRFQSSAPTSATPKPAASLPKTASAPTATQPSFESIPGFREPGNVPSNFEMVTGFERYEYLKRLEGVEPWAEMSPIAIDAPGTTKSPIRLTGADPVYFVACTGTYQVVHISKYPEDQISRY